MAEDREPVTTNDVAGAIRAMASFPWDEMLAMQRALLKELQDSGKERGNIVAAIQECGKVTEVDAGVAAAKSTEAVVEALEAVTAQQEQKAKSIADVSARLNRYEQILISIDSGIVATRRGIGTWGLIVSVLLFLSTIDDVLYLFGRLGRIFG